jgi:hypothetical protein
MRREEVRDAGSGGVQTEVIIMWWRFWRQRVRRWC